jgi:potassium efflux system protein
VAAPAATSAEQIQQKIEQITADTQLPETERSSIAEVYKTAVTQLQKAEGYAAAAADFRQALTDAPAETARLRQLLSEESAPIAIQVTADTSLQVLESKLATEQAQLANLQKRLEDFNRQLVAQQARPDAIRSELSGAQTALPEVERELASLPPVSDGAPLSQAQQVALTTRRLLLRNQIEMLEQELQSYDIRLELLKAHAAQTARRVTAGEARLTQLQDIVNARRRHEVTQTIRQSEATSRQMSDQPALVRDAAAHNMELSQQLAELVDRIDQATQRNARLNEQLKELQESYQSIRQQLEIAGLSNALGPLLRSERRDLPDIRQYQRNAEIRDQQIIEARLNQFQIDEQRRKSLALEEQMRQIIAEQPDIARSGDELQALKEELRQLLQDRQQLLDKLSSSYASYISLLATLDDSQHRLVEIAGQYGVLLDEKLFWIASRV